MIHPLHCFSPQWYSFKNLVSRSRSARRSFIGASIIVCALAVTLLNSGRLTAPTLLSIRESIFFSLLLGSFFISFFASMVRSTAVLYFSQDTIIFLTAPLKLAAIFRFRFAQIFFSTHWTVWILLLPWGVGLFIGGFPVSWLLKVSSSIVFAQVIGSSLGIIVLIALASITPVARIRQIVLSSFLGIITIGSFISVFLKINPIRSNIDNLTVTQAIAHLPVFQVGDVIPAYLFVIALCCFLASQKIFIESYFNSLSRLSDHRSPGRRISFSLPTLIPLPQSGLAQAIKEIRIIFRTPPLILQLLMFFGGFILYLLQAKTIGQAFPSITPSKYVAWDLAKTLLHLVMSGVIMAGFCSRIVFPSFSLEGLSVWILQIAPISPKTILRQRTYLWSIFLSCVGGILFISAGFSLNLSATTLFWSSGVFLLSIPLLVLLALVCGALFVRFDWEHPGAITGGWGSLLTFVFCVAGYFFVVTSLAGVLFLAILPHRPPLWFIAVFGVLLLCVVISVLRRIFKVGEGAIAGFGEAKALRRGKIKRKI